MLKPGDLLRIGGRREGSFMSECANMQQVSIEPLRSYSPNSTGRRLALAKTRRDLHE